MSINTNLKLVLLRQCRQIDAGIYLCKDLLIGLFNLNCIIAYPNPIHLNSRFMACPPPHMTDLYILNNQI